MADNIQDITIDLLPPATIINSTDLLILQQGQSTLKLEMSLLLSTLSTSWVSVKAYGAAGNGVVDDTAAVALAFVAAITASRAVLYFPTGIYKISTKLVGVLVSASSTLVIKGDGIGCSILKFTGNAANSGISITNYTGGSNFGTTGTISVSDLSIVKTTASGGTGIYIDLQHQGGNVNAGPNINNVVVTSDGGSQWDTGLEVYQFQDAIVSNYWYWGKPFDFTSVGMKVHGTDATDIYIDHSRITFAGDAIQITGQTEGINIDQCSIVATSIGVNSVRDLGGEPQLVVSNSHISTVEAGVKVAGGIQGSIHDCLIYQRNDYAHDWVGIDMPYGDDFQIHDITFGRTGSGSNTCTGVKLDATNNVSLRSIKFVHELPLDTGISISSNAVNTRLEDIDEHGVTTPVVNNSTSTKFGDTYIKGVSRPTANATQSGRFWHTPAVGSTPSKLECCMDISTTGTPNYTWVQIKP